jgi:ParB/RepB/Spo0J family partition protein
MEANDSVRKGADARFGGNVTQVPIESIRPSSLNPRKHFDEEGIQALAESIRKRGVLQPIVLREMFGESDPHYAIIAGERRWRASKLAGLDSMPATVIRGIDDAEHLELSIIENLERRDINPVEEARGYEKLRAMGRKVSEIAQKVNRSQEAVSNAVRLLKLPETVLDDVESGTIGQSHARAMLPFVEYPKVIDCLRGFTINGARSKDLEKWDWGMIVRLRDEGALVIMGSAGRQFNAANCERCPHLLTGCDEELCLNPPCFEQKNEDAKRENERKAREKHKLAADVTLKEHSISSSGIDLSDSWNQVAGCRENCERRELRQKRGAVVEICTDPVCHANLKRRVTIAQNKVTRAQVADKLRGVLDRFDGKTGEGTAIFPYASAVACRSILQVASRESFVKACEHLCVKTSIDSKTSNNEDILSWLVGIGHCMAIMLCAEVALREDLLRQNPNSGSYYGPKVADWFIETIPAAAIEEPEVPAAQSEIPPISQTVKVGDAIVPVAIVQEDKELVSAFDKRLELATKMVSEVSEDRGFFRLLGGGSLTSGEIDTFWRYYMQPEMVQIGDVIAHCHNGKTEAYWVTNKCPTEVRLKPTDPDFTGAPPHPSWGTFCRYHYAFVFRQPSPGLEVQL